MSNDITRDAFEAEANLYDLDLNRFKEGYSDGNTDYGWLFWQAATLAATPQWLPIVDAPKDVSILLNSTLEGVFEGLWMSAWYGDTSKCGWIGQNSDEEYGSLVRDVTHWMPLPATPQGNPA